MSSSQLPYVLKKPAKAPEKSNFVQTCNLLSQYVKEKGSIKDLNLVGIGGKMEATGKSNATVSTMNLLSNIENIGRSSMELPTPVDSLPQFASVVPEKEAMETNSSQMTIFYGGKVLVFDDLSTEKAREVMELASNGKSSSCDLADAARAEKYSSADALACSSKPPRPVSVQAVSAQEGPQPQQAEANTSGSDLPIARRSSLHRFLEKRKDRAVARGPYHQVQNAAGASSSSKNNEEQLELKL